jgi:predicted nucleic acid-binding protein
VTVLRGDFHWDGYRLQFMKEELRKMARCVAPSRVIDAVKDDPDDNRIVECAVEAGSELIVTEDNDLPRLGIFEGIGIVRPAEFPMRN